MLAAIVRKRLNMDLSLHTMLQILRITPCEKTPLILLFSDIEEHHGIARDAYQLIFL